MRSGLYLLNQTDANIHIIIVQDIYKTVWCSNLKPRDVFHFTHHNNARFYVVLSDGSPISVSEMEKFIKMRNANRLKTLAMIGMVIAQFVLRLAKKFFNFYVQNGEITFEDTTLAIGQSAIETVQQYKTPLRRKQSGYSFDHNNKLKELFQPYQGQTYKMQSSDSQLYLRVPNLESLQMRSQNSHYLKLTKCFAIRGGPKFNGYKRMLYFDRLREVRVDQDYLESNYYQIRGADKVLDSTRYFTNKDPDYLKVSQSLYKSRPSNWLAYVELQALKF